MESKHIYLSIDRFYLRALAIIQNGIEGKTIFPGHYFKRTDEFNFFELNRRYIEKMLELASDEESAVRLMVSNSVYQWEKKDPVLLEFMANYCYFDHVNQNNYKRRFDAINAIAESYCEPIVWGGEKLAPLTDKIYNPRTAFEEAHFCVYPLAEAAYARANYLSNRFNLPNCLEFVLAVNEHMDCYDIAENGSKLVPSIISLNEIKSFLYNPTQENIGRLVASSDRGRRKVGEILEKKNPRKK